MKAAIEGTLVDKYTEINVKPLFSSSVVLSSGNYPSEGKYGESIQGLEDAGEFCEIAHFNTVKDNEGNFLTAGGRTIVITSNASTLEKAALRTYESVSLINFESMKYRKDIGKTILIGC